MRSSEISRNTAETEIKLWIDLDGQGNASVDTGVGFLDHMLELFARHSKLDLVVTCSGDTYVDDHHSVEDIGIALGKAVADALGDKRGIQRYGDTILPMDEALILTAIDISGRAYLGFDVDIPTEKVGDFDTELVEEFLMAFVRNAGVTLHVIMLKGRNSHHIIEGIFKSLARSVRQAVSIDEKFADQIPSTKGRLTDDPDDEIVGGEDEEFGEPDGYDEPDEFEELEEPDDFDEPEEYEEPEEDYTEDDIDLDVPDEESTVEYVDEDEEPLYSFKLQDLDEPEEPVYSGRGEPRLFSDDTLFGDHDDGVDDIERLAEQMARQSLFEEREAESTGLADDEYGKELARGYSEDE